MKAAIRLDLRRRGNTVLYQHGQSNRCPSCAGTNWMVGRMTAECGFCGTAIPLASPLGLRKKGMLQ